MAARNRSYAAAPRRAGNAVSYARGLSVVLIMSLLCFALGFFVLARLLPENQPNTVKPAEQASAAPQDTDEESPKHPKPAPVHSAILAVPRTETPADTSLTKPAIVPQKPVIEPESDSAPPADSTAGSTPGGKPDENAAPNAAVSAPDASEAGKTPPSESEAVQNPTSPDAERGGVPPRAPDERGSIETAVHHAYRVQISLHATRAAAEAEAKRVSDKGFPTRIRPVMRGGETVYSVQYGTYKKRATAEAAQQQLLEAGINSYISER